MLRLRASSMVLSTLLLTTVLSTPSQAGAVGLQSDDFSGATLDSFWTFVDPLNDTTATLSGTGTSDAWINLSVPGGISHDAFNVNNAPRLTQSTDDVDFQIEVRLENPISGAFQFQGIYVEQDPLNWMRIDLNSNATIHRALALTTTSGASTVVHNPQVGMGPSGVPFWLRLTRSGDQWTQEYSVDGQVWQMAGTTFTHAMTVTKVGLMAGNATGASSPALTASFDYFFETASPVSPEDPLPCGNGTLDPGEECDDGNNIDGDGCQSDCTIPAFVSDDFSGSTLNSFWEFVDPLMDASLTLTGQGTVDAWVNFTIPGGIAHDAFNGNNAPRLVQSVSDTDFQLEIRLENPIQGAFQFQGIYVEQDPLNWMRVDVNSNATVHRALALTTTSGTSTIRHNVQVGTGPSGVPFWLRLTRSGDQWTQQYSLDGQNWQMVGVTFTNPMTVTKLGLMAGNAGPSSPALTASFDYFFDVGSPIDPEDPTEGFCGDGTLGNGEQCDDGNNDDGDGCQGNCLNPVCGDNIVDPGEECDAGSANSDTDPGACRSDCTDPGCGDGVVDPGEGCDDGDTDGDDGCSAVCQLETPCGNDILDPGEECDDGNLDNGDGCSGSCRTILSDDFSNLGLEGFWRFEDPLEDSSVALSGFGTSDALLEISVPAGTAHDAFNGNDAPRLVQDADDANFTLQTRIDNPVVGDNTFQGFLLQQDENNWLRVDIVSTGVGYKAFAAGIVDGIPSILHNGAVTAGPSPAPLDLQLTRIGNDWIFEYLAIGDKGGRAATTFTHAMNVRSVGLMAGNAVNNPGFTARFDYFFEAASPIVPEDPVFCGNGVLNDGEECDDGNNTDGDGCSATCTTENLCGNGNLDDGEECDDGNSTDGDGCSATCTTENLCGNGNLDDGEECDDGNSTDGDGCSATCTTENLCGNGNLDDGEECDDGNNTDGDGCSATCTTENLCGNGNLDDGEECDDGNNTDGDGCSATCTTENLCGNGNLDDGEECDDGNNTDGDGCSATCTTENLCGNGNLDDGEECDDGNNTDGDGCSATCTTENLCGNGNLDDGEECDDGNDVNDDTCSNACTFCIDDDPCDGVDNDCDGDVDEDCGLQMEAGSVNVGENYTNVTLTHTYSSPVVVATVQYDNNSTPVVARVSEVTGSSFVIRLQNPSGGAVLAESVSYWVVEEGVWEVDGVKLEAQRFVSTRTSGKNNWGAETRSYGQAYEWPVVLGQVMSENDARWSVFFAQGLGRLFAPSSSDLRVGKMVGEDPDTARADELIGYIVVETVHTLLGGIAFEAAVGADTVEGAINGAPFPYNFNSVFADAPLIGLATSAGLDGGDGGWAQIFGPQVASGSQVFLSMDEDQVGDDERGHTTEEVAYAVFAGPMLYPPPPMCAVDSDCDDGLFCNGAETCGDNMACAAGSDPCPGQGCNEVLDACFDETAARLESRTVRNVARDPVTAFLRNTYTDPVIACTTVYDRNSYPVVVRVDNVTSHSFDVFLQNPGDAITPEPETIHCLVVEEGSWMIDGQPVEAHRFLSTETARTREWPAVEQVLSYPFVQPVSLGQVMSAADARWSTYFQHGRFLSSPPRITAFYNGKTVGQDPDFTRNDEWIGFIVFEQGNGTIGGVPFEAALGPDTVEGIDNGPPFDYAFNVPFTRAPGFVVATQAGVDGNDGSWAYLYGAAHTTATHLSLAVDEEQLKDEERDHVTEQLAYVAFEGPVVYPFSPCTTDEDCQDSLFCNGEEMCNRDAGACELGLPIVCDDGVGCTSDTCDESAVSCVSVTQDSVCNNGLFCDGVETCDAALDCQAGDPPCGDPAARGVCDEVQDTCLADSPTAKMEWGRLDDVDGEGRRVELNNTYDDPVIVTSIHYENNTTPVVARIHNVVARGADASRFEIYLQNPSGGEVVADDVNYIVVEKGTWVLDGVAIEAQKYDSSKTAHAADWSLYDVRTYGRVYSNPVVMGQVMSVNDPRFSSFWSMGPSRFEAPSATALHTGKMVGEDPETDRADETIGFIVFEAGHGYLGGVEFEARVGEDTVEGMDNSPPYLYDFVRAFPSAPEVTVVTQAGMDGFNGGWMYTDGRRLTSARNIPLVSDEDQLADDERKRTTEQSAYCVFQTAGTIP